MEDQCPFVVSPLQISNLNGAFFLVFYTYENVYEGWAPWFFRSMPYFVFRYILQHELHGYHFLFEGDACEAVRSTSLSHHSRHCYLSLTW